MKDFTGFQRDILVVISGGGKPSGAEISQSLSDYYDGDVMGGRLYPNLDTLVENRMIKKGKKDDRTNEYSLTKRGQRELDARREWEDGLIEI